MAENKGGPAKSDEFLISYIPKTVHLELTRLWTTGPGKSRPIDPTKILPFPTFDQVPDGEMILEGYVRWQTKRNDLASKFTVQATVNDFAQAEVMLDEPEEDKLRRGFKISLRLNRKDDNKVSIRIPGLQVDDSTPTLLKILNCQNPILPFRLHLLVIVIDVD